MKIGIVTWVSYFNYGTSLQAYALQEILKKLGYTPCLIDDHKIIRSYLGKIKSPIKVFLMPLVKICKAILSPQHLRLYRQEKLYKKFSRKKLRSCFEMNQK